MTEEYTIESLNVSHYDIGFLETLASLTQVKLDKEAFVEILRKRTSESMQCYVLVFDQKVASTASIYIEQKFYGKIAHIEDVATGDNYRHQGFGTKVVQHCLQIAQEEGCYKAALNCNDKNVEWYRSIGFYRSGNEMRKDFVI